MRAAGLAERVRHAVLLQERREVLVRREEAVFGAAPDPQQLEAVIQLLRIGQERLKRFGGGASRYGAAEAGDAAEDVEVAQPDVERLAAAHRQADERAVRAVGV